MKIHYILYPGSTSSICGGLRIRKTHRDDVLPGAIGKTTMDPVKITCGSCRRVIESTRARRRKLARTATQGLGAMTRPRFGHVLPRHLFIEDE